MLLWSLSFFCFFWALHQIVQPGSLIRDLFASQGDLKALSHVVSVLSDWEDSLRSGLIPGDHHWNALRKCASPWGKLIEESLLDLRAQGAALIPTLIRLKKLAISHQKSLRESKSRASGHFSQALICFMMVPILGTGLYILLPGVSLQPKGWVLACGAAMVCGLVGSCWLLSMAQSARFGGIRVNHRNWILASSCAVERFLASIRCGKSSDSAWQEACDLLVHQGCEDLALCWGFSLWDTPELPVVLRGFDSELAIARLGGSVKRALQVSLMEGQPCSGKIEQSMESLTHELKTRVDQEIQTLGTRGLRPLFFLYSSCSVGSFIFWSLFRSV